MSMYLRRAATPRSAPQSQAIPGSTQVQNNAGGYAWKITPLEQLRRFLILGSEGGTYYAGEQKLTEQNIAGIRAVLDELGVAAVEEIVRISDGGRAPKNDPALYALAVAIAHPEDAVRNLAVASLPQVARTGTHLFHFVEFLEGQRGWGRAAKRAVAGWYEREDLKALTYQLVKYRQRDGWTHRDLLRLAHPKAPSPEHKEIYDWICGREGWSEVAQIPWMSLAGYLEAQRATTPSKTAELIARYEGALPREALNSDHLKHATVWQALIDVGMPMTALIRNLPTLTRIGLLGPLTATTSVVAEQLVDAERLQKARVHPLNLLVALATYASGQSVRGTSTWTPVPQIVDALDAAFYASFAFVEPTGKRTILGVDVSGSMGYPMGGTPLSCRVGAAALAMVGARTETKHAILGFSDRLIRLPISPRQRLDDVARTMSHIPFGRTDCALPMLYALENKVEVDVFHVITDNETWYGTIHPAQALQRYREQTGINAKLIVHALTPTPFSIADPADAGMLDVVGFDPAAPQVIADFARS